MVRGKNDVDTLAAQRPAEEQERQIAWPSPQHRFAIRITAAIAAVVCDVILIALAGVTAAAIRFAQFSQQTISDLFFVILPSFLLAAAALKCYRLDTLRTAFRSVGRTLLALSGAAGIAFAAVFAFKVGATYSRLGTGLMLVFAAIYLSIGHVLYKFILDRLAGFVDPHVVIFGPSFAPIAGMANVQQITPGQQPDPKDQSLLEQTYLVLRDADRVILAFDDATERSAWAQFMRLIGINAEIIEPELQNIAVLGVNQWAGTPTLIVARGPLSFGERALKRTFDVVISVPLLLITGPLLLLLMLAIKFSSPGPSLFAQQRVGRNNRRYVCYKLRSMFFEMSDPRGSRSAGRVDERITPIGRFLRRTSLDELPQLWNVICGDMSLVGPRPHALGSLAEGALFWEAVPDYWTRHSLRPGITGLAQVRGLRGATLSRADIERRVEADLEYINSWSIWLDVKILLQTIRVVLHQNAF